MMQVVVADRHGKFERLLVDLPGIDAGLGGQDIERRRPETLPPTSGKWKSSSRMRAETLGAHWDVVEALRVRDPEAARKAVNHILDLALGYLAALTH
jgi:hypothetical protein